VSPLHLAWLTVALASLTATAQHLPVVSYGADEGAAHPQVWSIFQDSRGYVWVGTSEGLSRWDGVEFLTYSAADGLHDLTVRTIDEDEDGRLWLGTDDGVAVFDGRVFATHRGEDGPGEGTVWCSSRDPRGRLWYGTHHGGVAVWTGTEFRSFTTADGIASDYVYALLADRQGFLWLGHRGSGLTRCRVADPIDLVDCRTWTTADGLAYDEVRALVEDERGHIWIGTRGGGVSRWDGARLETFTREHGLAADDIYALLVHARDRLVVATVRHGLTICELPGLSDCRSYGMANGLADDAVQCLALDRDGALWVGFANGLSQLWTEDVEGYTPREGLPHSTVYGLEVDADGTVWAGTLDGVARIRRSPDGRAPAEVVGWDSEGVLPGYEIWELARDASGRLWVATERGLCLFEDGRCAMVLTDEHGLADRDLFTVYPARDGSLWIGTVAGASRLRFEAAGQLPVVTSLTVEDGLAGQFVSGFVEDESGFLWLATDQGVNRWDGERLTSYTVEHGLPVSEVLDIIVDGAGRLWLGSNGGGLVGVVTDGDDVRFVVHGEDRGVPEVVGAMLDAGGGALWLGTGDGALLYDPGAADPRGVVLDRIDVDSGLVGSEVNALARGPDGALWIATSGGVTRIEARRERTPSRAPEVTLERARTVAGQEWRTAFGGPGDGRESQFAWLSEAPFELAHDFAALRFDFRALVFAPKVVHFQVRLDGFDQDWSSPISATFKEYTNLDPGGYTFLVRGALRDSDWGEPASLRFEVIPAWWQTGWFRGGALVGLVALVVGGVRYRTRRIRRRALKLERAVAERTDDLRRYARAVEEHSRALDRANVQIRHADKVKSEFLANMSHELRTPLNSIIGFTDVLIKKLEERASDRELHFLRNVNRSGHYLLLLINNLLDLSKIEADRMTVHIEEVELGPLLEDTLRVVQGHAGDRSVAIEVEIGPEPARVEVDTAKLKQILINLLSNAVKFSASGGRVRAEVRAVDAKSSALNAASYEVTVTDSGPGIREEDRPRIFEAFGQAGGGSAHPGGTGLGLALVKRYVTVLGGQIDFESELGEGTTFRVLLPVRPSRVEPISSDVQTHVEPEESLSRPRILVVDRDRVRFAELAQALEDGGLLPVRAGDAEEVQRMVEALRPAAVVLLWGGFAPREWTTLAAFLADPDALPAVHAADMGGAGPVPLAGDACLLHPVEQEDLLAAVQRIGVASAGFVALAGGTQATRESVREILNREGFQVAVVEEGGPQPVVDLVMIDCAGVDPEPVLAAAGLAGRDTPRVLLLPPSDPPRFDAVAEAAAPAVDSLAQEVRDLLVRMPPGRGTGERA